MSEQKPQSVANRSLGRARRARPEPANPYTDTETPRRAVIYIRVSMEEMAQGHSLEAQERECREFIAREKPNWSVVDIFRDEHSGKTDKRPGFQSMMRLVYAKQADAIVAHHLDRFSRNLHDILTHFKDLEELNVVLAFAKDRFDFSTEEGRLQFHILAVFADWYLRNLSRETRKGKLSRVLKGLHNNQPPFGYAPGADGIPKPHPEQADVVREMYELYSTGNKTDSQMADLLNERGFTTRRGRLWAKDSVREILQNETYLGMVKYRGDLYQGQHEPIISQELFDRVQQVRAEHARRPQVYNPAIRPYQLAGIAHCATCGRSLRAQGGPLYSYYREMSRARGFRDCAQAGKSIRVDAAEAQLGQLMSGFVLPENWREEIRQKLQSEDQRQNVLRERHKLEERLQRVGRLYADGIYSQDAYEKERDQLRQQMELWPLPDPSRTFNAGAHLETLADVWPHATDEERRELARLVLKTVYIDLGSQKIVRVFPQEDFVLLFQHNRYLSEDPSGGYKVDLPDSADL